MNTGIVLEVHLRRICRTPIIALSPLTYILLIAALTLPVIKLPSKGVS